MPRWSHSKSDVRDALNEADSAGFTVVPTTAHGHSWGYIDCPKCDQRLYVNSTPKNAGNHAKQIRRFLRHLHTD